MRAILQPWLSALAVLCVCLGGCTSVANGPTYAEARATALKTDKATVYVYRRHAEPTIWPVTVYFGNHDVAALTQGSFTWVNVVPGKHQVRIVWPVLSGQRDASIEIEVKPGTTYYLEVTGISRALPSTAVIIGGVVTMQSRMGSEINEVIPQAAEAALAICCNFRKPTASDY
jgi:hypothetical protein